MKNKLMISAAAIALMAAGGIANAQQPQERGAPKAGVEMKGGESRGGAELRGTTGQAAPAEKIAPRAEKPAPSTTGQAPASDTKSKADTKAMDTKPHADTKGDVKSRSDMKAQDNTKADLKAGADTKTNAADSKTKADVKSTTTTTTGQGAAGSQGSANLSTEQRTKIRTVIKQTNVRPVTNVNFSISVGARVPRTVEFHPLPVTIVEYYPAWRGYEFILVGDEIVVINPRTLEIVAVIEA